MTPTKLPWKYVDTYLILEIPDPVPVRELLVRGATLGQNAALKAAHVEQQVGIVLAVHGHEAALPFDGGHRARQSVLDVPEYGTTPTQKYLQCFFH